MGSERVGKKRQAGLAAVRSGGIDSSGGSLGDWLNKHRVRSFVCSCGGQLMQCLLLP